MVGEEFVLVFIVNHDKYLVREVLQCYFECVNICKNDRFRMVLIVCILDYIGLDWGKNSELF